MRFSYRMVPEVYQVFWAGMAAGEFINDAAIAAGSYRKQGTRWLAAAGGGRPYSPSGVVIHSCSRSKPSPPGLPGASFGPAIYPSSDIDM